MKAMTKKILARSRGPVLMTFLVILPIPGCYYVQAVRGHFEIMHSREPIAEVIADETSPDALRKRLAMVQDARDFAVEELLLDDNESYRSYADLGRDYVVWNVFAAPEFSLAPKTWCFPVAGCVAYRGYFNEDAARRKARQLREDGYDVFVGGVSAYSTLGRFADPVLNTMMRWSDVQLITTIFHELAHQKLYVKDETAFNESFATAVADIGIRRWLDKRKDTAGITSIEHDRQLRDSMMRLIDDTKRELTALYESRSPVDAKRAGKRMLFDALTAALRDLFDKTGVDADSYLAQPLNNARLASFGLYEGYQQAFRNIFADCSERLDCFYERAAKLAALGHEERTMRLQQLSN